MNIVGFHDSQKYFARPNLLKADFSIQRKGTD